MDALRGDCLAVAAAHLVEVVRHQPKGCDLTALPPELLSGLGKVRAVCALAAVGPEVLSGLGKVSWGQIKQQADALLGMLARHRPCCTSGTVLHSLQSTSSMPSTAASEERRGL